MADLDDARIWADAVCARDGEGPAGDGGVAAAGYRWVELWVYADNLRAVRLYGRLGWRAVGEPFPNALTGKPMQRSFLDLDAQRTNIALVSR